MAVRKVSPWSVDKVQTFLGFVANEKIQRELDGSTRNEKVYQEVAQLMVAHGYQRTSLQCREKLKKLKSDSRAIKDHNGRSGSNRRSWRWFDIMDQMYGHRPASNGREGGLDTATSLLEAMLEDDSLSISAESSATTSDDRSTTPGPAPTPAAASTPAPGSSTTPHGVGTGKRKRRSLFQQEHAALGEMQGEDVRQQELNRSQRDRHLQMLLDEAREAREVEAAFRREEQAQTAAFQQAFLGVLGQMAQALSSRRRV